MHLQARFNKHWAQTFPQFSADGHFVLAVSGGADSVVLAHLLKGAGINFEIAHCIFACEIDFSSMSLNIFEGMSVWIPSIKFS